MTQQIQQRYIAAAVADKRLPENAHRMAAIVSLDAPNDASQAIQFWQLYSVLGQARILDIVTRFYQKVYADEHWFRSVFANIGNVEGHISSQSSMWIDVMGGGHAYHGGEFRLNFHHSHNAMALMNEKGAKRWVELMLATLNDPVTDWTDDPRVRPALNTFLGFFMAKYAHEFKFENKADFGDENPALRRRINFMKMSEDEIQALSESELREALNARRVVLDDAMDKQALVNKALML